MCLICWVFLFWLCTQMLVSCIDRREGSGVLHPHRIPRLPRLGRPRPELLDAAAGLAGRLRRAPPPDCAELLDVLALRRRGLALHPAHRLRLAARMSGLAYLREHRGLVAQWFGVLGPAAAWSAQFLVTYNLADVVS